MKTLVKFNRAGIMNLGKKDGQFVMLKPGVNELDKSDWDEFKVHSVIVDLIKSGELEELEVQLKEEEKKTDLSKMNPSIASKLIKDTFDRDLLKSWLESEKRSPVVKSLKAQLEKLEVKPAKEMDASVG